MRKILVIALLLAGMATFIASCSVTRYVPDGELLLSSVKVKTEGDYRGVNTAAMRSYVRQQPNSRWFSLFKLPLATYSLSGRDSTKWINRTLKSIGEPPVVYDSLRTQLTVSDLRQELRNEGFLQADADVEEHRHGRKVDVTYWLRPGEPYFIHNISYDIRDDSIRRLLANDSLQRLIHPGMKFDVNLLDAERKRLTSLLTDNGYFRFHKEFITYNADTTRGSRLIDITLRLGLYRQSSNTPDTMHTRYQVRRIAYASGDPADSRIHLRRHVLEECTHLAEGQYYTASGLQNTYNHFGRLQAVRYTNISFRQVPDTSLLECDIQLQTNKPSTISFQPEGTNTAGDLGAAASLTYQNRNLFRGSEVLSVELRGAYEAIRGLEGYANQDFVEYSLETRLQFPRFVTPFVNSRVRQRVNATSELSLLYDLQDRPEFHRRVLSAAWRYRWSFPHRHDRYQLDLLDLNYVFMPWLSPTFRSQYLENESSRNAILRYNYEDLFITKIGFGYSYAKGNVALKTNIETSGNVLSAGARLFQASKDDKGQYRLFNIAFAQYA